MIEQIRGGVTAAAGFLCGSTSAGIKNPQAPREDLALVYSELPAVAAGTFTTNLVKAAPVRVSMEHIASGEARAVVLNSGNANACTGPDGLKDARRMAVSAGLVLGVAGEEVLVCSTGRIGVRMPIARIEESIPRIKLSNTASLKCAKAIMTSDTFPKEIAVRVETPKGVFHVGGIAKGAGMIDPNMATMLCVITTDAKVSQADLKKVLGGAVEDSFNRITIDGDMSTNDTVIALANGASKVRPPLALLREAFDAVAQTLARMIVKDGEGVTKFVEIALTGAASKEDARKAAEAIANSTLVKCAWAGGDPNWGRIMDAMGYSGAKLVEEKVSIDYEDLPLVRGGLVTDTPWKKVQAVAARKEFRIGVDLGLGRFSHTVWTTDLTEEYVRLNLGE
ncbi:bifunctional glutamate N-acetyltransferase/amino-acid acetyltransferase ArgJ [Spartobacteria bacterium LR76]|nr:bifunctional glutamate N-acetyltransferase/amino-acid acetyltransferase ArgJ [Spartobacteria bacterium LR76]